MRTIKFRVWDKNLHKFLISDHLFIRTDGLEFIGKETKNDVTIRYYPICDNESNNFIVQQFTDLIDKNNKEIYEGDLVKIYSPDGTLYDEEIRKIVYSGKYADFIFRAANSLSYHICKYHTFEVVGNIFENPELLP